MLTVILTSSRVAPGLLSWEAWAALREASGVFADSAGHPQAPALAPAGIEVSPGTLEEAAAMVADGKRAVWLAPPDSPAESFTGWRVVAGSEDLPGAHLIDAVSVMDTLRVKCPWDSKQTHESLLKYLLEEAYEAADAIETGDFAGMREELGDVLLQVLFHARVASERSGTGFTADDVADELVAKLKRRHPHVFGSVSVSGADDVNRNWEEIKKAEKAEKASAKGSGPASVLDGIPFGQPALSLATQLVKRASKAGFPGADSDGDGVGTELMDLVAKARAAGTDPELELRAAARRFADQVRAWERTRD